VRPTDENQPASKRPNLMSPPRRPTGEIHILAMLDGHAGRSLSRRVAALPMAWWYGGAGLLACTLVGLLVWLAGTGGAKPARPAAPGAVVLAAPAAATASITAPAPTVAIAPDVVLHAPEIAMAPSAPTATEDKPAAFMPAVLPTPAPQRPTASSSRRPAAVAVTRPTPRPALRSAPRLAIRADAPSPRPRRTPASARSRAPAPGVDTDVALISAILQHGGAKLPDATLPDCVGGPCTFPLPER
jgi:hypothetical protein